ncbi:hypothetical protein [Paenibacillus nasutitermitis]|uniref:Uncharacterized protein n=1 Tax=Paenibacillus nasutitermitis TaxID=1652958 RepID=A0A916Z3L5_9BACL|nr:hypothetical protein [Paenibacillus nasutitermitis]GGD74452.1 hypothetical protein GCM10010911_35440 [Paenibacillus nasutitermitis]
MDTRGKNNNTEQSAYLFQVDILVEGQSNARAAERLLHLLNQCGFPDFRIKSGLELGKLIEALETAGGSTAAIQDVHILETADSAKEIPDLRLETAATEQVPLMIDRVRTCISDNRLIRLSVNKGFGVRLNIPCRIIKLDENNQMLTVYHVDEKQVYTFSLNEIDDFVMQ